MSNENEDIIKYMPWKVDYESITRPDCLKDVSEELMFLMKNSKPFSDYYNIDGTLKPHDKKPPIFSREEKEGDSEQTKKSNRILAEFLNKTYTKEIDDEISKKFINAMIYGIGIGYMGYMEKK